MKVILSLQKTLNLSILIFIILLGYFIVPFPSEIKRMLFMYIGVLGFIFLVLGVILLYFSKKEKGKLKFFLIITGISAILPFSSTVLHNAFYALSQTVQNFKTFFEFLHVLFFTLAIAVAPIVYAVGIIGSYNQLLKDKKNEI